MINMKLWIGNIAPGTSDEAIRKFVKKYSLEMECTTIQRVDGDGSRPAATLEFVDTPQFGREDFPAPARNVLEGAHCSFRRWAVERTTARRTGMTGLKRVGCGSLAGAD